MLTFQVEPVEQVWNQVMELAAIHWNGTKSYRRHYPFNPILERFSAIERVGMYRLFTARDGTKLVGYFGVYLALSMHSQHRMATEDTFFLHPDYRGGRNAIRFLKHIEQTCREWGTVEIMFSCEKENPTGIKRLLEFLDFCPVIVQYSKRLLPLPSADSGVSEQLETHADVGSN